MNPPTPATPTPLTDMVSRLLALKETKIWELERDLANALDQWNRLIGEHQKTGDALTALIARERKLVKALESALLAIKDADEVLEDISRRFPSTDHNWNYDALAASASEAQECRARIDERAYQARQAIGK